MNKTTRLIFIRHGETLWTVEKRYQGHSDTRLTARGRRQALALARFLKDQKPDALYTSVLGRARETGTILADKLGLKPAADKRINELYFGRWEGKTGAELTRAKDPAFLRWASGEQVTPPGGESAAALRKRTAAFLKEILKRHAGKSVAVVSHAGAIKNMICQVFKMPPRSFWAFRIDPASVSTFDFYGKFVQCVSLNQQHGGKGRRP